LINSRPDAEIIDLRILSRSSIDEFAEVAAQDHARWRELWLLHMRQAACE
jgi:hypothetical protein